VRPFLFGLRCRGPRSQPKLAFTRRASYLFRPTRQCGGRRRRVPPHSFRPREEPADVLETRTILVLNDPAYEVGRGLASPTVLKEDSGGRLLPRRVPASLNVSLSIPK